MFIVTAVGAGGERSGCLIGFAMQCSVHPPRFLACISKENHTFGVIGTADTVAVHFLSRDQKPLAELFGGQTGDEIDKFELCDWTTGPEGVPVLTDVVGWFTATVLDRLDLGDHTGLWLQPFEAQDNGGTPDLGFQSAKDIHPGHPV
jgi:flavin reductase (DIM6/NTAB) family NADH-FMN oxidoreductase RutF